MKTYLFCGIAIASALMFQSVPASAQRVLATGHPHVGHGHAGPWRGGYTHGYGPGYGIGAGAAAVATGALIGGAIATQNQGYYYPQKEANTPEATTTRPRLIPDIPTQVMYIATPFPLRITAAIPWRTANKLTDHTTPPVDPISAMTGIGILAHDEKFWQRAAQSRRSLAGPGWPISENPTPKTGKYGPGLGNLDVA